MFVRCKLGTFTQLFQSNIFYKINIFKCNTKCVLGIPKCKLHLKFNIVSPSIAICLYLSGIFIPLNILQTQTSQIKMHLWFGAQVKQLWSIQLVCQYWLTFIDAAFFKSVFCFVFRCARIKRANRNISAVRHFQILLLKRRMSMRQKRWIYFTHIILHMCIDFG